MLVGTSIFTWGNIAMFIFVSKFVNGDLELSINIPSGKGDVSSKDGKEIIGVVEDAELPFSIDVKESNQNRNTNNFKRKFKERIDGLKKEQNELKEEQVSDDGSFSYDENIEMKMQDILGKLDEEIGDDLPAGIEVVTDEYEKSLERKK